jgi:hypothetical protein
MQNDFVNSRYEEGKAELSKLIAEVHKIKNHEMSTEAIPSNSPSADRAIPGKFSEENALLNSRNIFHEKLIEHEANHDAYLMLSNQYKSLGLEGDANAYEIRAQMEATTAQGFRAVAKSCDRDLEPFGIQQNTGKPRTLKCHLEAAQRHLEEHKNSHAISSVYIHQVADNRTIIQQFETEKSIHFLSPYEMKQYSAALHQRDSHMALAEQEAVKAAVSYKRFQVEMNSAERSYEGLGREKQSAAINHDSHEPPSPERSEKSNAFSPERERFPINPPTNGHRFGLSKAEAFRQMVNDINREL